MKNNTEQSIQKDSFIRRLFGKFIAIFKYNKESPYKKDWESLLFTMSQDIKTEYHYVNDINPDKEKKRIFSIYKDVKDGKKDLKNLSNTDLLLIKRLLDEERKIIETAIKLT